MSEKTSIANIFLNEEDKLMGSIVRYLQDEVNIKGVTIHRAISGFGNSGALHSSEILSMSLDLPIVVEFFDDTPKVEAALKHLKGIVKEGHMIMWPVKLM